MSKKGGKEKELKSSEIPVFQMVTTVYADNSVNIDGCPQDPLQALMVIRGQMAVMQAILTQKRAELEEKNRNFLKGVSKN